MRRIGLVALVTLALLARLFSRVDARRRVEFRKAPSHNRFVNPGA